MKDEINRRKQFAAAVRCGARAYLGRADEKVWHIGPNRVSSDRLAEMIENGEKEGLSFFQSRDAKIRARGLSFEESLKPLLRFN